MEWKHNNKPQCQLCGKFGHIVLKCYNPSYSGFGRTNINTQVGGNTIQNQAGNNQMSAMFAAPDGHPKGVWFPDSGATNPVTNELGNLYIGAEYNGGNKLFMGNGTGLGEKS